MQRNQEIDIFRGIAVIGVVFSHVVGGVRGAGLLDPSAPLYLFNEWFYAFRMPAIALVLGMFISYGAEKYGSKTYIARRAVFALYMYVIWYVIQMSAEVLTSSLKNHPVTIRQALSIWEPVAHLWFVPYIAVSAAVIAVVRPWERAPWLTAPLLVLASVAVWGWSPGFIGLSGLALIGFSTVGAMIGVRRARVVFTENRGWVLIVGALALLAALPFFGTEIVPASVGATPEQIEAGRQAWLFPSVILSWLGQFIIAGVVVIIMFIPRVRELFALVGRHTLSVYLAHIIVIAGLRIVLMAIGVDSLVVLVPVLLIAGVVVPLIVERVVRSSPLRYVFEIPDSWLPGSSIQRQDRSSSSSK
ncbi:acyltransferase family protein [Brevibacterium senegalense]|uniref:acyltransferase family protein n=1 Tax=Brevibacterium senegalense TaxID=1033736 RepID=UPI00030E9ADA|nr:acyltransferase [Brevibacterium senegalense]